MVFSIDESQRRARARLGRSPTRRRRSDAGRSRLPAEVLAQLHPAALAHDRPPMKGLRRRVEQVCADLGLRPPARASLYNTLARFEGHTYVVSTLPLSAREALYNLAPGARVPGHQLVFHCLNYGSLAALSFAAGLPWLDLYQARLLRGWRPRSRGLLTAVLRARGMR